jgi:hypothetical protein
MSFDHTAHIHARQQPLGVGLNWPKDRPSFAQDPEFHRRRIAAPGKTKTVWRQFLSLDGYLHPPSRFIALGVPDLATRLNHPLATNSKEL